MAGREVACVVNRCYEAKESNNLDLSSCQLTSIPDAIFVLMSNIDLRCCTLSQNLLKRIPSKFATKFHLLLAILKNSSLLIIKLKSELDLSNNHLNGLPEELKQMESLTKLDISCNEFTLLPSVVYKLESLKLLSAEKNNIKDIDVVKLKQLPNMEEINMQDNPLTQEAISQLMLLTDSLTVLLTHQDSQVNSLE
ncbi:hypothetical protein Btru_035504 [Bulinus truncatus]|nr:hypothetical protein Btru_035504 [Bulinus truncatus]